jgi:putative dimethyl sulfoxide reductase chaperone
MQDHVQANEALARSNIYGLLSRVTRAEVDAPLLAEFRQPAVAEALREAGADLSLPLASVDDQALLQELAVAYTHLFLLTVNPHESVQRGEGRLWGEHTVAVGQFMEEAGLAVEGETSLLPDHISLELAVMQYLTAEEAAALAGGDRDRLGEVRLLQRRFVKEHLGHWGLQFFAKAKASASHPFYQVVAQLGAAFLHAESEGLAG